MSTTRPPTPLPIQGMQLKLSDLQTEGLPTLNQLLTNLQTQINTLTGANGKTVLSAGLDVSGATVSGVGEPQSVNDAVSKQHAEANYSAPVIGRQLESGSKYSLKSFRALNSRAQQETNSTFLNSMMNTAPTCNSSTISAAAPSGGSVVVTVSAGFHFYVDNNKITPYAQRMDTLALPNNITITSAVRTSNVVTLTLSSAPSPPINVGDGFAVSGVTDTTFDGSFIAITGTSGSTLVYSQTGINATSSSGSVSVASCYYYYLQGNSQTLALSPPFPADTQQNRLSINVDQSVLIAVAVLDGGGLVLTQSAAGATPPIQTANSRLLTRL
jgi:hypothetical protein